MKGNLLIHEFYCVRCGFKMELPRKKSKKRESGHLKKLYCCNCKEEINFVECNNISYTREQYLSDKQAGVFEGKEYME